MELEEYMEIVESMIGKRTGKDEDNELQPGCSWQTEILNINNEIMKTSPNSRFTKLKNLLRLDHLNLEEQNHVQELIQKYENLFKLPEESLTITNKMTHKINTIDKQPVNVKQYRFPPIHKEEINR
jgi:Fe2+ transport system protein B